MAVYKAVLSYILASSYLIIIVILVIPCTICVQIFDVISQTLQIQLIR